MTSIIPSVIHRSQNSLAPDSAPEQEAVPRARGTRHISDGDTRANVRVDYQNVTTTISKVKLKMLQRRLCNINVCC